MTKNTALTKSDEKKIIYLEGEFMTAVRDNQVTFFERYLHDNYQFLSPQGILMTKHSAIASHAKDAMKVELLEGYVEDLCVVKNSAIVVLNYQTKGSIFGERFDGDFRFIRIWKITEEGLQVMAGSCQRLSA